MTIITTTILELANSFKCRLKKYSITHLCTNKCLSLFFVIIPMISDRGSLLESSPVINKNSLSRANFSCLSLTCPDCSSIYHPSKSIYSRYTSREFQEILYHSCHDSKEVEQSFGHTSLLLTFSFIFN